MTAGVKKTLADLATSRNKRLDLKKVDLSFVEMTVGVKKTLAELAMIRSKLFGIKKGQFLFRNCPFNVTRLGFEPKTYCLEGNCSIQLS